MSERKWTRWLRQVWPMLPNESYVNPQGIFQRYEEQIIRLGSDAAIPDDQLLEQVRKMWGDQEARLSSIDSRAGQLMAAAGIAASLTTTAVNQKGVFPIIAGKPLLIGAYLLALVYFAYCITTALRVHGERRRYLIGPEELAPTAATILAGTTLSYARYLALELLSALIKNYQRDNLQAQSLYVAQRAFRNAVVLLVVGGVSAIWS